MKSISELKLENDELCRKLAESEAKVAKLWIAAKERRRQINQLKEKLRNPEKRFADLTAANAALEAKLLSADDALMECFSIACLQGGAYRISREAEAAHGDACDRYEARKKGAEHGE